MECATIEENRTEKEITAFGTICRNKWIFFFFASFESGMNWTGWVPYMHNHDAEANETENRTYDFMTYLKKKPYIMIEMFTTLLIELNSWNFFFFVFSLECDLTFQAIVIRFPYVHKLAICLSCKKIFNFGCYLFWYSAKLLWIELLSKFVSIEIQWMCFYFKYESGIFHTYHGRFSKFWWDCNFHNSVNNINRFVII